jgi:hypothetical protein
VPGRIPLRGFKRLRLTKQEDKNTIIEKKSSLENLVSFKKRIFEETEALAVHLLGLFPDRTPGDIHDFIYAQFALSIGIYPMLNLSEK